jgi:hypothetical protein
MGEGQEAVLQLFDISRRPEKEETEDRTLLVTVVMVVSV